MSLTRPRPASVLLVDGAKTRDALRDTLEAEGWAVTVAASGRDAVHLLTARSRMLEPSAIVLGMEQPPDDAVELLTVLASYVRLARIPVIAVTVSQSPAAATTFPQVKEWFAAPADAALLVAAVRRHIARGLDDASSGQAGR
jgi:CheY-like chemotaxis protein